MKFRRGSKNISTPVVVALGGSIMYPDQINWAYLRRFKKFIGDFVKHGQVFVIVGGGGRLARMYQGAAAKVVKLTDEDKDWLGIHATRSNAHLLRTIFREIADPVVIDERFKLKRITYPITIASGWRPGWSTDFIAVRLAADLNAKEVVIAGTPSHVFDKDFTKYKDAVPFTDLSWAKYRRLIPAKWKPGFHSPVDPVAARLAEQERISAAVLDGRDLKNFGRFLRGESFIGTTIR